MDALGVIIGAIVGGSISLIGTWIQQKSQFSRELVKIAHQLAITDYENSLTFVKQEGETLQPLESYVTYYLKYFKIVRKRNFEISDLKEVRDFKDSLHNFYLKDFENIDQGNDSL